MSTKLRQVLSVVTARGMQRCVYIYTCKVQFISFRTFNVNNLTMKSMQSLIFHSAIFSLVLECFTIDKEGRLGRQTRNPVFQPKQVYQASSKDTVHESLPERVSWWYVTLSKMQQLTNFTTWVK